MKRWLFILSLMTVGFISPGISKAQDNTPDDTDQPSKVEFSVSSAALNKYVWRGLRVTNGPVLQPSATLGMGNFLFNAWANMDLDNVNDRRHEINEVDYTLEYGYKLGGLALSLGAIRYTFPTTDLNSTTELYLASGLEVTLRPTLRLYQDIGEVKGTYASLSLGHSLPLEFMKTALDISTSLGWGSSNHNRFYYGVAKHACADFNFGLGMPFSISEKFILTPTLGYSGLVGSSMRSAQEARDYFLAGVNFSSTF